jgi:hypothetical protein
MKLVCDKLNVRRWLAFDLLCGCVSRHHPMFAFMLAEGISERDVLWFADNPCPPNVIGVNYYATSDRYLDHRMDLYPAAFRSSEGSFVDVEAVRMSCEGIAGFESLLRNAWERYKIPVAITEVHLGGPVEEQIRWVAEAWEAVGQAKREGVECVALTIWALMGSFYWNQLVTCENGHYEPGTFDVRGGMPHPTELAGVVRQIANGKRPSHPALTCSGWWRSNERIQFPCAP